MSLRAIVFLLAVTFLRGTQASALELVFDGEPDEIPLVGNEIHVLEVSASGFRIAEIANEGEISSDFAFMTANIAPVQIANAIGTEDFELTLELDPTSANLPTNLCPGGPVPGEDLGYSQVRYGLLLIFSNGSANRKRVMIGWSGTLLNGHANYPFFEEKEEETQLGGGTFAGSSATGTQNQIKLVRQGTGLQFRSYYGAPESFTSALAPLPSSDYALVHFAVFGYARPCASIPLEMTADAGKFRRVRIVSPPESTAAENWALFE